MPHTALRSGSPAPVGVGLRHPHYRDYLEDEAPIDFVELHAENFFARGGASLAVLGQVREKGELSLHGTALGLGSAVGLDPAHVARLAALVGDVAPRWVSEHACFARAAQAGRVLHALDLLPVAYSEASLALLCAHVDQVQERLGRRILVENLSAYVAMPDSPMAEVDFLVALARRSGCGLLVDLNNLMVNACNAQLADPLAASCAWLDAVPADCVGELHLAGCTPAMAGEPLIDDHARPVSDAVWQLYRHALGRFGPVPTLVEWDADLPPWDRLLAEASHAAAIAREVLA